MKKKNIYVNQSQELLSLFEEAGNGTKIMCVPIDYAKKDHIVMFCNGYGHIFRKPFSVKNSPEGIEYLTEQVTRSCSHRRIDPKHVFFGGEDVGSYAENFANTLRSGGWIVAGVNAHDAKEQRANIQASTDRLDLMGIASMLLNRRANCSPAQSGIYRNLRTLVRHRRNLVSMSTEEKNRIHTVIDRLFPGFLDEKMETRAPGVYAVGDILGPSKSMLAHTAATEGIVAAENALGKNRVMDYKAVPSAIFTMPEVADVGLTESQAKKHGYNTRSDSILFRKLGKAHVIGAIAGQAKIVSDADSKIVLGVHIIGPHATELIAEGALAVQQGLTVMDIAPPSMPIRPCLRLCWRRRRRPRKQHHRKNEEADAEA